MEKVLSDKVHGGDNEFESLMEQSLQGSPPGRCAHRHGSSDHARQRHRRYQLQVRRAGAARRVPRPRGQRRGQGRRRDRRLFRGHRDRQRHGHPLARQGGEVQGLARARARVPERDAGRGRDPRQGQGRLQGRYRRAGLPARLARRYPPGPQPRSLHRPARALPDAQVQPRARQRGGLAPRRARARARPSSRNRPSRCSKRA